MEHMNASALSFEGLARLSHLGVIEATGADAASFLHGQLTQDVALLDLQHARLAAYCSAKGRMLASFVLFKTSPERVLLVCSRDILPATLKRLSMFVLRARCKLVDQTQAFHIIGAAGQAALKTGVTLTTAARDWPCHTDQNTHWVGLHPANGCARALGLMPVSQSVPACSLETDAWLASEVLSGVVTLSQPVVETFVPQMLNYESVGGVNFKKGCYPGQEVVARSQFRGTLKRRAIVVTSPEVLQAGQEVFSPADPEQPCGTIAQSAPLAQGCCAIVSVQIASQSGPLHAGSVSGPLLTALPLPYPLLEDI